MPSAAWFWLCSTLHGCLGPEKASASHSKAKDVRLWTLTTEPIALGLAP